MMDSISDHGMLSAALTSANAAWRGGTNERDDFLAGPLAGGRGVGEQIGLGLRHAVYDRSPRRVSIG